MSAIIAVSEMEKKLEQMSRMKTAQICAHKGSCSTRRENERSGWGDYSRGVLPRRFRGGGVARGRCGLERFRWGASVLPGWDQLLDTHEARGRKKTALRLRGFLQIWSG
ncbi:hypothetical protein [Burkholderia sp. WAC0059]|uniref:hypothetical protein n=1 Tax=Burkholderia sp. WAC0059 TaxID=2066022 RepID=UPI0015E09B82|nr:hypothetical protein [Burkholderia sp. WAC0059]